MKPFLAGLVIGVLLVPCGAYLYFRSGNAPVATSAAPLPLEKYLAQTALHAKLRTEAPQTVPIQPTDEALLAGARVYRDHCAVCHGLPSQLPTVLARGMFPRPPQLFHSDEMVTDDPPGVTFWKALRATSTLTPVVVGGIPLGEVAAVTVP